MSLLSKANEILQHDLNAEFMETVATQIAWEYHSLYENIVANNQLPLEMRQRDFSMRRSDCAHRAISFGAKQHGIPIDIRRLAANGQHKMLLKMGRIVLIQEPMREAFSPPQMANYKAELALSHGVLQQLELPLNDRPERNIDWSGSLLAVLLHGAAGPNFIRRDKALGALMIAVPDNSYENWITRVDLHDLALFGAREPDTVTDKPLSADGLSQQDEVTVRLRRNNNKKTGD